jgi:UDPglucose--hexose-1-phosphate uridylyltransferase
MQTGHIRLNKATGEWVIYAPSRRKRPQELQHESHEQETEINYAQTCPFCPGREHTQELGVLEIIEPGSVGWRTRVIPNKYPALTPCKDTLRVPEGIYVSMPGYGQHEVVIESPEHYQTIATMPLEYVETVIETYHQRYMALMRSPETKMVTIFRNNGLRSGASQRHPHSQIIATGIVPRNRRLQEEEAQRYFDQWGRCVYCDILEYEMSDRRRVLQENKAFVAFVPFAAEVPFEVWIMPKHHQADFGSTSAFERSLFAAILKHVLAKLYDKLNNPDYNYVINTAPRYKAQEPHLHWYCQIRPRLTTPAGFEIGTGISINPSIPEIDAEFLSQD